MSYIADIANPYMGAFVTGLFYSLAACTASCLPVVAGYIAGVGSGFKGSLKITMFFNSGRLLAYTLIGAITGLFSGILHFFVSDMVFSPFQMYFSIVFGAVTIIIGVMVMLKARKPPSCDCSAQNTKKLGDKKSRFGVNFGAFSLGLTRGLILCPALMLLLFPVIPFTSPIDSVGIAVFFGLGTMISPLLLLAGVTGWLLNKAPLFQKWISIAGGAILILLGIFSMLNLIIQ
ncbi:sulfite exporter TauE/SafE family protein [Candidatus Bathycorpusculum sp.]|jgi:sulfite exporter TauE/SafE|uniref:sulfite exporter TauE/SafE family protein n=1 Tax=Candidatus Bathycorpusculum sp. TaxID=2994959 RepID=UPI00282BD3AC|nr:sulfite exporter TauE/SafE family protein [Candidatus Termitimicrobium sp.]MCL2686803.1 sulfite exporter TauE/SafE family protein [Candidatus Termitimicrobium sp.]